MTPPFGLAGGGPGAGARVSVVTPDGSERRLNTKGTFTAEPNAQVVMHAPGSGGYGPRSERDPARVREDAVNGYVSAGATCPTCEAVSRS